MLEILVASVHFLLAFTIAAALAAELLLFRTDLNVETAKRLQTADKVYGFAVVALLAVGLIRVLVVEEHPAEYLNNPAFWVKMGLFAVIGLLSAYPSVRFLSWKTALATGQAPKISPRDAKLIPWLLRAELLGLAAMIISAVVLAQE